MAPGSSRQTELFPAGQWQLLADISRLPLTHSRYRQWTAKPRTVSFGGHYDSAYIIPDVARWKRQHAISPTRELRNSITFRTLRKHPG